MSLLAEIGTAFQPSYQETLEEIEDRIWPGALAYLCGDLNTLRARISNPCKTVPLRAFGIRHHPACPPFSLALALPLLPLPLLLLLFGRSDGTHMPSTSRAPNGTLARASPCGGLRVTPALAEHFPYRAAAW